MNIPYRTICKGGAVSFAVGFAMLNLTIGISLIIFGASGPEALNVDGLRALVYLGSYMLLGGAVVSLVAHVLANKQEG